MNLKDEQKYAVKDNDFLRSGAAGRDASQSIQRMQP